MIDTVLKVVTFGRWSSSETKEPTKIYPTYDNMPNDNENENESLREQITYLRDRVLNLQAENNQLRRELARVSEENEKN
jgi:molecular chaperone GrpE (heat shock protein)